MNCRRAALLPSSDKSTTDASACLAISCPSAAPEHDNRIAGRAGAQSPPHTEGIDNRDPGSGIKQALNETLCCIDFARTGGADDRNAVIKRCRRQHGRGLWPSTTVAFLI
jgi:hypothetical protein